jgi:pantoate--beta-alanine ligase
MRFQVLEGIPAIRRIRAELRRAGATVALVPTMGALHDGHLSLVHRARAEADRVLVSVYVNPLQFGPDEDLEQYPRDLDRDADLLETAGADVLWTVSDAEMYPTGYATHVTVHGSLADGLCGARRPGHFQGVTTVVTKLFNLVQPDLAVFGQKDLQQATILCHMVEDLNLPVRMIVAPTVREPDGLALSSRNAYLQPPEREAATALYRGLCAARDRLASGERDVEELRGTVRAASAGSPLVDWEYIELVHRADLTPQSGRARLPLAIVVAARVGNARLIDNIVVPEP